jgi:outer membrane protein OmpA-like peptidoglycan-associated protein
MQKITVVLLSILFSFTFLAQDDSLNVDERTPAGKIKDSILSLDPDFYLTPEFYKKRYVEEDLMYKITDNYGNGFDSLYGTRNLRPILHGIAYRGGGNNYFHKENKRNNHNPLPDDGIRNLCQEGFSASIYLYRENFETAPSNDSCDCIDGGSNDLDYYQLDYFDKEHIYEALKLVYNAATNDTVGPVYMHCWNGWHASGLFAALTLRQFCGYDKWEAINYWDLGTDGANNSPRYQKIREMIKDFEPYEDLMITDSLGNTICPPMPKVIDSAELYVDIEHLVYVPESLPVGFSIVLHNVSFGSGQTSFSRPEQNVDLVNLLKALNDQPDLKVELGGYTDNVGSTSNNIELSRNRAKFVYDFLLKKGINEDRITYKGYGPKRPLYSNRYSSTREGNRRIEVKIMDKAKEDYSKLVEESSGEPITEDGDKLDRKHNLNMLFDDQESVKISSSLTIKSIEYEPNMVEVPEQAKEDLNKLASFLKENPNIKGEILGHTDKSGLEELNQLLSEQSSEAVYKYLLSKGVPKKQISFKGYGSDMPVMSNKYQYGKEANRRIDFKLVER